MVNSPALASESALRKDSLGLMFEQEQHLLKKAVEFCGGDELAGQRLFDDFFENLSESDYAEIMRIPSVDRQNLSLRPGVGLTSFLRTFSQERQKEKEGKIIKLDRSLEVALPSDVKSFLHEKCLAMFPDELDRADEFYRQFLLSEEAQEAQSEIPSAFRKGTVDRSSELAKTEERAYEKAFEVFCRVRSESVEKEKVQEGRAKIGKVLRYTGGAVAAVLLAAGAAKGVKSFLGSQEAPYKMLEQVDKNPELHPEIVSQLDKVLELSTSYSNYRDPDSRDFREMEASRVKDNEAFWASVKELCEMLDVSTQEREPLDAFSSSFDANVAQLQLVVAKHLGKSPDSLGRRGFMGPKTKELLEELRAELEQ